MQLKSLEIKGFKSFADRTVVNFNQPITGVVGPNGCGKSNIVDAIRWVLGEQKSKELRSEKMSNVIFAGTRKRKPSGMAQVSLTFENTKNLLPTEYHTVTITRMLYRSGESEYRLNNVNCRLKDIKTLLMDTGIGSNSYAIIALGMVDDLLNDRENSRRRLFEQAAGISKYKVRKRETFNKLKGTEADLNRVEDLLFEIEGNLKTLEKQAKRTKKYFEIKEQYKDLSLELAVFQLSEFKTTYKSLKAKIQQEQDNKLKLETEAKTAEAALEKEKRANIDKEKSLSEKQRALNRVVGMSRGKENDKKVLLQKMDFIRQNQTNLFRQIESGQDNVKQNEEDIIHYRGEINREKKVEMKLEDGLEEAEAGLKKIRASHGSMKSELDVFLKEQQVLERQVFELEKKRAIHASRKDNLVKDIERHDKEIQRRNEELKNIKTNYNQLESLQKQKEQLIQKLEEEEQRRDLEIKQTEEKLEGIKQEIVKLNRQLDAKQNEYKLTKSLVDKLEGFPESIKFLSKNKSWSATAPLFSDIIYCKKKYRIAIENYLETYLNYYVVKNVDEALKAISLLSQSQRGKANFFLMDQLSAHAPNRVPSPEGMVHALDIVDVEEAYLPLCRHLLGNVWLTESENSAELMAIDGEGVILSEGGKYVKSKFTLAGGSVGLFEGKRIGRKKNLEILDKEISQLTKEGKQFSTTFEQTRKALSTLKNATQKRQIEKEKNQYNRLQRDAASMNTKLENFESFLNEVLVQKKTAENTITTIDTEVKAIVGKLQEMGKKVDTLKQKISQKDHSYKAIADQLSAASTQYNQRNIEFIRQQNKINALQRELSFREKQLADFIEKLEQDQKTQKGSQNELKETQAALEELEVNLLKLYEEKKTFEADLNEFEQVYYSSRGQIHELEDEVRRLNKANNDSLDLISSLKDRYTEVRLQLSGISERMRIEFQADVNVLINKDPNPAYTVDGLEAAVERLKKRIDNYGEINPMAVEAYDEMNERFQFITAQRNDLREAKESLLQTIEEIENTATKKFMEAFAQVRENFIKVFRSLFTEDDSCDLTLSDEKNPLESTIKITAKPKGKRPQTINQLSGGEKTLTATALLFSLYLLKPAPFCIFDEVDAPLDDANVYKFNKIISKFSKDSQFIIITHVKQTMAFVDVIYGVTMAEQGVSRVVPVDFRSLDDAMSPSPPKDSKNKQKSNPQILDDPL